MTLKQTIYISRAHPDLTRADLQAILATSVRCNDQTGLTGFLLHGHGLFLQVLEGPADAVQATLQRILADPRHSNVDVLQDIEREQREFGRWSMGFKDLDADELARGDFEPFLGRALTLDQMGLRPVHALRLLRTVSARP